MAAGRKRIPDWMRVVDGNRARKPTRKGARPPKTKKTAAPAHLSDDAKQAWGIFEPQLRAMGVFHPDFTVSLEQVCELYADIRALRAELAKSDRYYKSTNREGHVMIRPHPAAGQLADTERRFQSYLSDFGLTPVGRAKLMSGKVPTKNAKESNARDEAESFF